VVSRFLVKPVQVHWALALAARCGGLGITGDDPQHFRHADHLGGVVARNSSFTAAAG